MKKATKKILSAVLVLIMLLTAMPLVFAQGQTYETGDVIQFGSYPQAEVKDETLITELYALAPEWDEWTSYGYYSGDGEVGSMVQGDWMRYIDVTYNNVKYRGVKFTQYRPFYTTYSSSSDNSHQDDNGYSTNTVYWFKFSPIEWRVIDPTIGLLVCETIIDSQPYSNNLYYNNSTSDSTYGYFNDSLYSNFASDYETSLVRKWLNNDFYNIAFTDNEKEKIDTATLNNNSFYTSIGIMGYELLDSNETRDKIFLLSYGEAVDYNSELALNNSMDTVIRRIEASDYAKIQGLYYSATDLFASNYWLLRTPGDCSYTSCSPFVINDSTNLGYFVSGTFYGVMPALKITYLYDVEFEKPADPTPDEPDTPSDPTDKCSCNCHKGGIAGFFFKILNFFQKLFGKNKVCACGVQH